MRDRPAVVFVIQRNAVKEVYGGEKSTIATAKALAARGIDTHFIVNAHDDFVDEITRAGLTCDVVPMNAPFDGFRAAPARDKLRRVFEVLRANRAVAECVRARGAGVVDVSTIPAFLMAWLGARFGGAKVIYHVRTASRNQQTRLIEEIAILLAQRTVAVSHSLREQLLGTGRRWLRPVLAPRVLAIPNGFDFDEIDRVIAGTSREVARAAVGPAPDRISVLLVGALFIDKGQLRFIERVLPAVVARAPEVHVTCVGGTKDPRYHQACLAAIERLGLGAHIELAGYKPQHEVFRHYLACDLVVLPSEREGLPRCGVEAQAFGRPIVATAVVGSTDAVKHGQTGFLAPNDRIEEMADPIVDLARDPGLRRRMGEAGAAWVRSAYTIEANARAMSDLFRSLA